MSVWTSGSKEKERALDDGKEDDRALDDGRGGERGESRETRSTRKGLFLFAEGRVLVAGCLALAGGSGTGDVGLVPRQVLGAGSALQSRLRSVVLARTGRVLARPGLLAEARLLRALEAGLGSRLGTGLDALVRFLRPLGLLLALAI